MKLRKIILLLFICIQGTQLFAQKYNIATFNIRNDNSGDVERGNGWTQRLPVIAHLIQYHEFDILGTQEVLHHQLTDLLGQLGEYDYVGVGRDDGKTKGEYAPIFYRKDKFNKLQSGTFWLAEKTDAPVKGWDAALPRICTYAQFEDKISKRSFWVFNLHMDHVGIIAREKSSELMVAKVQELAQGQPSMLMGDFNVDQHNKIYSILNDSKIFQDAYSLAPITYALNGTFNAFDPNLKTESRIDHIFVSPNIQVEKYGVLTDSYRLAAEDAKELKKGDFPKELSFTENQARMPSDHFPVAIRVDIK